jgi:hypothetical protein
MLFSRTGREIEGRNLRERSIMPYAKILLVNLAP